MYLHGSVNPLGFYLWVEDPARKIPRVRTSSTMDRVKTLPIALSKMELATVVENMHLYAYTYVRAVAWLPTIQNIPLTSTELNYPFSSDVNTPIEMMPWGIPALKMEMLDTIRLLVKCMAQEKIAPDIMIADDLHFWAQAIRFAATLLVNQHFSPTIQLNDPSDLLQSAIYAQWVTMLTPADRQIVAHLIDSMPGSADALTIPKKTFPLTREQNMLLFIERAIDVFVHATDHIHRHDTSLPTKQPHLEAPSPHNQWLNGLRSHNIRIQMAPEYHKVSLFFEVQDWLGRKRLTSANRGKLCFRLSDPVLEAEYAGGQEDEASWRVDILVQSLDDHSLLLPIQEIWEATAAGKTNPIFFTSPDQVRNMLAVAARQYPALDEILQMEEPAGFPIDDMDAYRFLTSVAPALEEIGYDVLLPAWWMKGKTRKVSTKAFIKSATSVLPSVVGLDTLLDFQWQVAIGDAALTKEELEALAKAKAPLVRLKGQWMHVNPEEIKTALNFLRKQGQRKPTLGQTLRMALDDHPVVDNVAIEQVKVDGWLAKLLKQFRKSTSWEEYDPPATMQAELRPYQIKGYSWLRFLHQWGMGACLADDMGLGKTIQALALIQHDWDTAGHAPVLLVCPTSVIGNWHREAQRFTPTLPLMIHHGSGRSKDEILQDRVKDMAIVVTSYSLLHRDLEQLKTIAWRGVILDEAQNIKNPETKQMQAACEIPGNYRLALTGTPVENHIGDLWSIMEFLNPGILGSKKEFQNMFLIPIQGLHLEDAARRLKQITRPFILRRVKTDPTIIRDLPDKFEMKVYCTLTKEQASLYAATVRDLEEKLAYANGIQRRGIILASLTHLKQVCNHPTLLLGDNSELAHRSGKLARMEEMLEEVIEEGDRALIFTQFAEMGKLLQTRLSKLFKQEILFLYGQTPQPQREAMIKRFQDDANGPQIFILSLKAGGTGINLMRANHVFHFDRWWNPAVENQATDRAYRIGQTKSVQVHKMVTMGTLEERIDMLIESKKALAEQIIGNGEAWLTELSTAQLRDLVSLRQEALEG